MDDKQLHKATPKSSYASLPVLPLKNMSVLPSSIIPVIVGRRASIAAVEAALKENSMLFVTSQKQSGTEQPSYDDLYTHGTRSTILQVMRIPKGGLKILIEGICRCRLIVSKATDEGYLRASCLDMTTTNMILDVELEALWRTAQGIYNQYLELNPKIPTDLLPPHAQPDEMEQAIDTVLIHLALAPQERQAFLEIEDLKHRVLKLCSAFEHQIFILKTQAKVSDMVQTQIDKFQKEYYIQEQIKALNKELGRDDFQDDISQIRSKIKSLKLPPEVKDRVERELKRLESMPASSAESATKRHYIDWLIALPWHKTAKDTVTLAAAEKILNKKHAGLHKAKERILEYLAAKKFAQDTLKKAPIICLVGPPGVGKTSLAESIAESLGREFKRISLGGIQDEAEIRGHRSTYIGALPGRILQIMRSGKTVNPVLLLDEIDKLSHNGHGDPGAALLEVLDPEQNKNFVDHFIELPYDLSQVMFIATANNLDGIPLPLHDRMEIITLAGYTEQEKFTICQKFLIPKNLKEHALAPSQCKITEAAIQLIISEYTKEAGVRQVERVLTKILRKTIQRLLNGSRTQSVTLTPALVKEWLGYSPFKISPLDFSQERIGLASGLAWTELGGDLLEIEAKVVPGKGNVTLTGQLGEVMQESAYAALTYIRSRAALLGLKPTFNTTKDIHIHIPEGATPKDGPSAGITMCVALISELIKSPINPTIAMTGEITLSGRVLPVGGLKAKILAAEKYTIKEVLLPKENEAEIQEMREELGKDIRLTFVSTMDEVLEHAFLKSPFVKTQGKAVKTEKTPQRRKAEQSSIATH